MESLRNLRHHRSDDMVPSVMRSLTVWPLHNEVCALEGTGLVFGTSTDAALDDPIRVVVDRDGSLPAVDPEQHDLMITSKVEAPKPWVSVDPRRLEPALSAIGSTVAANPVASAVLARTLRLTERLDFQPALEVESLAYSVLLGGAEFARWLAASGRRTVIHTADHPVSYARDGDRVTLTLDSAVSRNAMTARMRDALYESLANVRDDPTCPDLVLQGTGRCFSVGGALDEFGSNRDLAQAHLIRTQRSCALLLHQIGERAEVMLHGACVGSGIEIPAAAARRVGRMDTAIWLPEIRMGLIPGAGGTVTLARAIGRHRLLWLALSGARIGARRALQWGLLHEIAA